MADDVVFACDCGAIHGHLSDISVKAGVGLICYCSECRAAEVFLDQPDPEDDGVAIFQTSVDRLHFGAGADRLYAFSFGEGKRIRWYAKCCKVPLFITGAQPQGGYLAVMVDRLANKAALGRIRAMLYQDDGKGGQTHVGMRHVTTANATRRLRMRLTGKWKDTPFFGKSGAPVSKVHVLSKVEKSQLPVQRER